MGRGRQHVRSWTAVVVIGVSGGDGVRKEDILSRRRKRDSVSQVINRLVCNRRDRAVADHHDVER